MSLPPKADLSAFHSLQFYRKKKDWKLYDQLQDDENTKKSDVHAEEPTPCPSAESRHKTDKKPTKSEFKANPANNLISRSKTYINTSNKSTNITLKSVSQTPVGVLSTRRSTRKTNAPVTKAKLSRIKKTAKKPATGKDFQAAIDDKCSINNKTETDAIMKGVDSLKDNEDTSQPSRETAVVISRNECFKVIIPGIEIDNDTQKIERVTNETNIKANKRTDNKVNIKNVGSRKKSLKKDKVYVENDVDINGPELGANTADSCSSKMLNLIDELPLSPKTPKLNIEYLSPKVPNFNTELSVSHKTPSLIREIPISPKNKELSISPNTPNSNKDLSSPEKQLLLNFINQLKPKFKPGNENTKDILLNYEDETVIPAFDKRTDLKANKAESKETDTLNALFSNTYKDVGTKTNTFNNKPNVQLNKEETHTVRIHNLPIYAKLSHDEMLLEELIEAKNKVERRLKKNLEKDVNSTENDTDIEEITARLAKMNKMEESSRDLGDDADFEENITYEENIQELPGEEYYEYEIWNDDELRSSGCGLDEQSEPWVGQERDSSGGIWRGELPLEVILSEGRSTGTPPQGAPWMQHSRTHTGYDKPFSTKRYDYDSTYEDCPTRDVGLNGPPRTPVDDLHGTPSMRIFDPQCRASQSQFQPPNPQFGPQSFPKVLRNDINHGLNSLHDNACGPLNFGRSDFFDPQFKPPRVPPPSPEDLHHGLPCATSTPLDSDCEPLLQGEPFIPQRRTPIHQHLNSYDTLQSSSDPTLVNLCRSGSHGTTSISSFEASRTPSNIAYSPSFEPQCEPHSFPHKNLWHGPQSPPTMSSFDSRSERSNVPQGQFERRPPSLQRIPSFDPNRPPPNLFSDPQNGPQYVPGHFVGTQREANFPPLSALKSGPLNPQTPPFEPQRGLPNFSTFDPSRGPHVTLSSGDPVRQTFNQNNESCPPSFLPNDVNENSEAQRNYKTNNKDINSNKNINIKEAKNENKLLKYIQAFNERFIDDERKLFETNPVTKKDFVNEKMRINNNNNNNDFCSNKNIIFQKDPNEKFHQNNDNYSQTAPQNELNNYNSHKDTKVPNQISRSDYNFAQNQELKSDKKNYGHKVKQNSPYNYVEESLPSERNTNNYLPQKENTVLDKQNYFSQRQEDIIKHNEYPHQNITEKNNHMIQKDIPANYFAQHTASVIEDNFIPQKEVLTLRNNNYFPSDNVPVSTRNAIPNEPRHFAQKDDYVSTNNNPLIQKEMALLTDNYFTQKEPKNEYYEPKQREKESNKEDDKFFQPNTKIVQNINIITQKNVSNNIQANLPVIFTTCARCDQVGVPGSEWGRGRGRLKTDGRNLGPQHFYQN